MLSSSCDFESASRKSPTQQQQQQKVKMNSNNNSMATANGNSQQTDQERRYRPQKYCSVCGDKAIACNFNAVTCESCKAFFRRNAFKEQRLKCLFENRCVIDRVTRRFCSKCRLLKCFQIGMKREWILTDEQKQIKRVKILQNKQSKQSPTVDNNSNNNSPNNINNNSSSSPPPTTASNLVLFNTSVPTRRRQSSHSSSSISVFSSSFSQQQQQQLISKPQVETKDASTSTTPIVEDSYSLHYCSLAAQCHYCSIRIENNADVEGNLDPSSSPSDPHHTSHLQNYEPSTTNDELYVHYPPVAQPNQFEESVGQQQQPQLHTLTAPQGAYLIAPSDVHHHHELYQQQQPLEPERVSEISASNPFVMALDAKSLASPALAQREPVVNRVAVQKSTEFVATNAGQDQESGTNPCIRCSIICVDGSQSSAATEEPWSTELERSGYIMWRGEMFLRPAHTELEARERVESLEFSSNEKQLIEELLEATRFMFSCSREDCTNHIKNASNDSLNNFVYFCDAALRRLIKTVKQVKAFRLLSMDDQIVLLKTACFKILLLRSTFHYQQHLNGWLDLKTGKVLQLEFLKKAKKSSVFERHNELVTQIPEPLRRDRVILSIMSMALLFDPNIGLKHSNSVGLDNLIYLSLLRKYLLNTQPDPLTKYELLVAALQKVNACNEEYNVFFSEDFQPGQITPLLVEIFDISINNSDI